MCRDRTIVEKSMETNKNSNLALAAAVTTLDGRINAKDMSL